MTTHSSGRAPSAVGKCTTSSSMRRLQHVQVYLDRCLCLPAKHRCRLCTVARASTLLGNLFTQACQVLVHLLRCFCASAVCCWLQVCYSWWCLSCLSILGRLHWIDRDALSRFILYCQVMRAPRSNCGRVPAASSLRANHRHIAAGWWQWISGPDHLALGMQAAITCRARCICARRTTDAADTAAVVASAPASHSCTLCNYCSESNVTQTSPVFEPMTGSLGTTSSISLQLDSASD
jgi:hypothetical protein